MMDETVEQARAIIEAAPPGSVEVRTWFDPDTSTATHLVVDAATGAAAIVDPVLGYDPVAMRTSTALADELAAFVRSRDLRLEWLLETHIHADHLSAASYLRGILGGRIALGAQVIAVQLTFAEIYDLGAGFPRDGSQFDRLLADGERFRLGSLDAIALHVPGHTPADLAYVIGDAVFVGDTLMMPDTGTARADFPGADARQLYHSARRLLSLPGRARLFHCHDYTAAGRPEICWESTVAAQRQDNIHVRDGVGEDHFVATRTARDATLTLPRLMLPAIRINIDAGSLPRPAANGTRYLNLPLDRF